MKTATAATLSGRLALKPLRLARSLYDAHESLVSYASVVMYQLATYANNDVNTKTVEKDRYFV